MPRNSSGTYSLPEAAFVSGTTILSDSVNSDFSDIATALTQSLATTGVSTMTGPVKLASGSLAAPSLTFGSNTDSGFRLIAVGNFAAVINNTDIIDIDSTGIDVIGEISKNGVSVDAFPTGTKMLFFQTTPPTGWTKDVSLDNAAIRLVSGTVGADAGTADFTSAFAARTILQANLPNVNFTVTGTVPLTYDLVTIQSGGGASNNPLSNLQPGTSLGIDITGVVSGTAASGGSGTAMDFAVKYADAVRASKN